MACLRWGEVYWVHLGKIFWSLLKDSSRRGGPLFFLWTSWFVTMDRGVIMTLAIRRDGLGCELRTKPKEWSQNQRLGPTSRPYHHLMYLWAPLCKQYVSLLLKTSWVKLPVKGSRQSLNTTSRCSRATWDLSLYPLVITYVVLHPCAHACERCAICPVSGWHHVLGTEADVIIMYFVPVGGEPSSSHFIFNNCPAILVLLFQMNFK